MNLAGNNNILINNLVDLYKRVYPQQRNFRITRNNLMRNNNFVEFVELVKNELQGIQSEDTSPLIKQYVQKVLERDSGDNVINRINSFINQELPYFTYPTQNVPWTPLTPNNVASNYNNTNNNNSIIEPGAPIKRGRPVSNNNNNSNGNNRRPTKRALTFPDPPNLSSLSTLPNNSENSQEGGKRRVKKTHKQRKEHKQKKTQRKHR